MCLFSTWRLWLVATTSRRLPRRWGDRNMAEAIIKAQMDRVAKMFGYKEAWFG